MEKKNIEQFNKICILYLLAAKLIPAEHDKRFKTQRLYNAGKIYVFLPEHSAPAPTHRLL